MSRRTAELLLADIREAIEKIDRYTGGLSLDGFMADEKTQDAVVRNLEIIGEAANRLPQEFKVRRADIEWPKIVGLRHRIVHDYFGIDLKIIWRIINEDLRVFKAQLQ
jgi:uncharacterized protein with HEPN domain